MKKLLLFFLKYYLFWLIYFVFFKALFLLYNHSSASALTWSQIAGVFFWGSRMDLSVAGYLTMLPGLLMAVLPPKGRFGMTLPLQIYTLGALIAMTLLGLVDMGLFPAWGCRLNSQLLPYLYEPSELLTSLSGWHYVILIGGGALLVSGWFYLYLRVVQTALQDTSRWFVKTPVMILLSGLLILPIRGGVDTSPLNFSSVSFSSSVFANQSAYNYFWSFSYALLKKSYNKVPVHEMDLDKAKTLLAGLDSLALENPPVVVHPADGKPVNVVLVILESFSNRIIEPLGGMPGVTPCFNKLTREGLLFTNFYATGSRSDKGISSLIASYPAVIKACSVLQFPDKISSLDLMPSHFEEKGYDRAFFYGGDPDFFNQKMLFLQAGVKKLVGRSDFPVSVATSSKWGAPDEELYKRALSDMRTLKEPYLSMLYTLSSHDPFDIPAEPHFKGKSEADPYLSSVYYSDQCLGQFVDALKKQPSWKHTLLIITADHTSREPDLVDAESPDNFKIPMLWLGGALQKKGIESGISMQTDLAPTLMQQLGWKPKPNYFAKNMFGSRKFAYFCLNSGWGIASPEVIFFKDVEQQKVTFYKGEKSVLKDSVMQFGAAFTQFLHEDFFRR